MIRRELSASSNLFFLGYVAFVCCLNCTHAALVVTKASVSHLDNFIVDYQDNTFSDLPTPLEVANASFGVPFQFDSSVSSGESSIDYQIDVIGNESSLSIEGASSFSAAQNFSAGGVVLLRLDLFVANQVPFALSLDSVTSAMPLDHSGLRLSFPSVAVLGVGGRPGNHPVYRVDGSGLVEGDLIPGENILALNYQLVRA